MSLTEKQIKEIVSSEMELAEKRIMEKINGNPVPPSKKKKEKKDPNAPKKPLSAFLLFSGDKRPEIKEKTPEISFAELSKKLGELWKSADKDTKDKYNAMSADQKEKYKAALVDYTNTE